MLDTHASGWKMWHGNAGNYAIVEVKLGDTKGIFHVFIGLYEPRRCVCWHCSSYPPMVTQMLLSLDLPPTWQCPMKPWICNCVYKVEYDVMAWILKHLGYFYLQHIFHHPTKAPISPSPKSMHYIWDCWVIRSTTIYCPMSVSATCPPASNSSQLGGSTGSAVLPQRS